MSRRGKSEEHEEERKRRIVRRRCDSIPRQRFDQQQQQHPVCVVYSCGADREGVLPGFCSTFDPVYYFPLMTRMTLNQVRGKSEERETSCSKVCFFIVGSEIESRADASDRSDYNKMGFLF